MFSQLENEKLVPAWNQSLEQRTTHAFLKNPTRTAAVAAVPVAASEADYVLAADDPDPVFAAIDAHRAVIATTREHQRAFNEAVRMAGGIVRDEERGVMCVKADLTSEADRLGDSWEAERSALWALVDARPTTWEGAEALIGYLGEVLLSRDGRFSRELEELRLADE